MTELKGDEMKVFYHNDLDGKCAANIIYRHCQENVRNIEFIEMNYDKPFPIDIVESDEVVWIVDFSIEPTDMKKLLNITPTVIWIDHHITAINKYNLNEDFGFNFDNKGIEIHGLRKIGFSGSYLTFEYLYGSVNDEGTNIVPYYIKLVDDWDCWKHKDPNSRAFNAAMHMKDISPTSDIWARLHYDDNDYLNKIISDGTIVLEYNKQRNRQYLEQYGYEVDFEGYKCIVCHQGLIGSDAFESVEDKYDIYISGTYNGTNWILGLYSTKIDVSSIAVKYGGGGHKGASGFHCEKLPWREI